MTRIARWRDLSNRRAARGVPYCRGLAFGGRVITITFNLLP